MITVLNRRELVSTYDMKRQAGIREILAQNNIDYTYKIVNRDSPSPIGAGTRAYMGTWGEKAELTNEYTFYVKKCDYDRAIGLIDRIK